MNYLNGCYINHFCKPDSLVGDAGEDNWYHLYNSSMSTQRDFYLLKETGKDKKNWFPYPSHHPMVEDQYYLFVIYWKAKSYQYI